MKENYIKYTKKHFKGKAKKYVLNQIELFYETHNDIRKNKYNIGDDVFLKKGTFLHGIGNDLEKLKWIKENGFIASEFNGNKKPKKYFNNVGFWNIKNDCYLKDYINQYSGITIRYNTDRGRNKSVTELISYNNVLNKIIEANNNENIWSWSAEQTKEIRFMPCLSSDKNQMAFILNMESNYAKKLSYNDIFNKEMPKDILKYFIINKVLDDFINKEKDDFTTNRESGIMFGLPSILIEGVLVGKIYEKDKKILNKIKEEFPECYICNIEGKVIK